jgi:2-hydroxy-6-oxo-6-(2'-aminophenyl)hexa-2,4-dienoate hydrolase
MMPEALGIERRYVDVDGLRTHYLASGQTGVPIVLVHGGGAGADSIGNWTTVIATLSSHFRVFAPDMVGFGHTVKPRDASYAYTQDGRDAHLEGFLRALDVGPVVLVGNSMGGLTSLGVARRAPALLRALVLMGSAGIPIPPSDHLAAIVEYDFSEAGMARLVEALTGQHFVPPPGMIRYRHVLSIEDDTRYAYERITGWMKARGGLQIEEALIRLVSAPTLVVAGKNDRVVPVSCAYKFLELIPQSRGYIMPNCGHWPMIEYPAEFASVLKQFIDFVEAA